jgi:hypothetical protein
LITIALVIVTYVDNRTVNDNIKVADNGYMESVATANGFAGTVKSNLLTLTTTTGFGLMQGGNSKISPANPKLVTSTALTGYNFNAPGKINEDQTILEAFDCLMTRSTTLTGFIAGPTNLDNLVTNDQTVLQSLESLQGQLNAAKLLYLFRADNITVALGTSDTLIWTPMIYGTNFLPPNTLVEGSMLYFETSASLTIVAESDTTTTFSVGPAAVSAAPVIHLSAAVYLYNCKVWVTMVNLVSATNMTYAISAVVTATNNATGSVLTANSTMQSQTLNPQFQQQFEIALKVDTGAPVFDVSSAFGAFLTKPQQ